MVAWVATRALAAPVPADAQHARVEGTPIAFVHSRFVEVERPTSLAFGPDGRLYVSRLDGMLLAYTVARVGPGRYEPVAVEAIDLLQRVPNRDDDGRARPDLTTRLVTGIATAGTASRPIVYATSSDPRMGDKGGTDLGIDTRSGAVSRLAWTGAGWQRDELLTGLPRSREDHAPHGLAVRGDALYVCQGGNTNMGAPSKSFSGLAESPLSAAILTLDLRTPGAAPRVFATGLRNPYDLVVAADGAIWTVDNGPNHTWGGPPSDCSARPVEGGATWPDTLHRLEEGAFAGHANPSRGQCEYLPPPSRPSAVAVFPTSTNGLAEYTSRAFGGLLGGGLVTVSFDGRVWWIPPGVSPGRPAAPDAIGGRVLADNVGVWPLDVIALGDDAPFPGTVWIAVHATGRIQAMEPE